MTAKVVKILFLVNDGLITIEESDIGQCRTRQGSDIGQCRIPHGSDIGQCRIRGQFSMTANDYLKMEALYIETK